MRAPVLGYPNNINLYTLTIDASLTGNGEISIQKQGTEDRVIAYASKTLSNVSELLQQLSGLYLINHSFYATF